MTKIDLKALHLHLKQVVHDYCKFSGLDFEEVTKLISKGSELARDEWNQIVKTGSDEEIFQFYTQSKYYIYETLQPYLEPDKYKKDINYLKILEFAKKILKEKGRCKVLDFGGGIGELCILLAKAGCETTYSDLPGAIAKFAEWRFNKYGVHVKQLYSRIDGINLPACEYDLIVSDAVIEHLNRRYLENFIQTFSHALLNNGYIYLLWDPTYTQNYPYHILGMKARELDNILKRYSLVRVSNYLYVKSTSTNVLLRHFIWRLKFLYVFAVCCVRKLAGKLGLKHV